MEKEALIIFIKKPVEGKVKTRLAKSIGNPLAVKVYTELLQHTENITSPLEQDVFIFSDQLFDDYFTDNPWLLQEGPNLGVKMFNAFKEVFSKGYNKVCIIGSDCYELDTMALQTAFKTLSSRSSVIGPSYDGGYYLLGLTHNDPDIFNDIDWSTKRVLQQTIIQMGELSINHTLLPYLNDLDDIEDLKKSKKLAQLIV